MRRRESGSAAVVLLLMLAILATMFAMNLTSSATTALQFEQARYGADRARLNALSGITLAERSLKSALPSILKRALATANESPETYDTRFGVLSGATFEPILFTYDPLPGDGLTHEDTAHVDVEIALRCPPETVSLAGVPAGGEGEKSEKYTFEVRLTSTGRSIFGAAARVERISHLYAGLVLGGGLDPATATALGSGNIIAAAAPPLEGRRQDGPAWAWELVPAAYADTGDLDATIFHFGPVSQWTHSPGGPPGGWSTPPEVITGPHRVGLTNGDCVYYWYMRGVPGGTVGLTGAGGAQTLVLATDDWRFDPSYDPGTDTIAYRRPDGLIGRKQGSPLYAVVAVQAPGPTGAWEILGESGSLQASYQLSNHGIVKLEVIARDWLTQVARAIAPNGVRYTIAGVPSLSDTEAPTSTILEPNLDENNELFILRATEQIGVETMPPTDIQVRGASSENSQLFGLTAQSTPSTGMISLLTVRGRRGEVRMEWQSVLGPAVDALSTINSNHEIARVGGMSIDGSPPIVVSPPPQSTPPRTLIIAMTYVPIWTYSVNESY
jgi:hypothetical protein